ncbi:DltD [Aliarcobacter cryaerophilus ATCC 43158]|uniref:D-alanyl carrier protein:peptidoglycan D-alanyltransferase n=1 Tax=Aliarcobacter cryaerophilus ATCC 43158 TaxID=1032070 RepID=A0AAD0XA78_9BACT|nr:D-alanyl-lipoteichoic acid biosynthesis protein DltD [Aliarcobacter cryaerophilus]AYJ79973.1 D-alanyl carrier protein:peptidoglycan D-alanyltransferase [Aliarcobacter cryaerophilus ATCC 43158]PRM97463.1 DltD [Aliarcobacter cryaerophilus]QCZ24201.1 DltD [Aliarcobacter cryaerophilus ATCC 43158]
MNNRLVLNISALFFAFLVVFIVLFFIKDKLFDYYFTYLESLKKTVELQSDLENGKIVLFGSSELVVYPNQKFLPQNFFNNDLKIPLRVQGNEGHQSFVILSQLAAFDNKKVRQNAKVVVMLSPSWFTGSSDNGLTMAKFLEYMNLGMMNKLYFEGQTQDKYKFLISDYIQNNISYIKEPTFIYETTFKEIKDEYINNKIKKFIIEKFDEKYVKLQDIKYFKQDLNFDNLKNEAKSIETSSSNNKFGIQNEYYSKYIEPQIAKNNFPFEIVIPPSLEKNEEYQDFLDLLDFLDSYKIKPLFIMQDLHPHIFIKNRENANLLMETIKSKVLEHNFEYMDMWTYKKEDYEIGTLIDIVHFGELGWVKANQKIVDYFVK